MSNVEARRLMIGILHQARLDDRRTKRRGGDIVAANDVIYRSELDQFYNSRWCANICDALGFTVEQIRRA